MILVEATAKEYREHGSFVIPNVVKQSWSHPVIADGKLYLREQDDLYCYDVKATQQAADRRGLIGPVLSRHSTRRFRLESGTLSPRL